MISAWLAAFEHSAAQARQAFAQALHCAAVKKLCRAINVDEIPHMAAQSMASWCARTW